MTDQNQTDSHKKTGTGKRPVGRPPFEITDKVLKKVESLSAQGLTRKQVALILGIHYDTYNEKSKEFPELPDAFTRGRAKGIGTITNALFNKAKNGDTVAIKHYLKHTDKKNWGDPVRNEHSGPNGGPIETEITEHKVIRLKSVKPKPKDK